MKRLDVPCIGFIGDDDKPVMVFLGDIGVGELRPARVPTISERLSVDIYIVPCYRDLVVVVTDFTAVGPVTLP